MRCTGAALVTLAVLGGVAQAQPKETAPGPAIENGSNVQIEYTLKDETGKLLDSNTGRGPLSFTQGEHRIIPGLEKALNGMRAGEEKQVSVKPEEGYGAVDAAAQAEVPKAAIPSDALTVGTELMARSPTGTTRIVRIKEIKETTVILDLNHPLAGKTLHFTVKILSVAPAK